MKRNLFLVIWYLVGKWLPKSTFPFIGKISKQIRYLIVKKIFIKIGKNVNVENLVHFGNGKNIIIGDNSGIGKQCRVPSNIRIGNNVMMAEEVIILNQSHEFNRRDIPMCKQGFKELTLQEIGNDVWIGTRVIILPQVTKIGSGVIIGSGAVVTKDIPDNAIVVGNPAKVIRYR